MVFLNYFYVFYIIAVHCYSTIILNITHAHDGNFNNHFKAILYPISRTGICLPAFNGFQVASKPT